MPYYRRWARRSYGRRRTTTNRYPLTGTRRRVFMNKTLRWKRAQQMDTRTMWFTDGRVKEGPPAGSDALSAVYRTYNLYDDGAWVLPGLEQQFETYDQFQVKAIKITWYPRNAGNEGAPGTFDTPNPPTSIATFEPYVQRGDICSYLDQRYRDLIPAQLTIGNLVNFASFRMHNTNRRFTRTMYRPKANTRWGETDNYTDEIRRQNDGWNAGIYIIQNGIYVNNPEADPPNQTGLWYAVFTVKITFRGRKSDIRNV